MKEKILDYNFNLYDFTKYFKKNLKFELNLYLKDFTKNTLLKKINKIRNNGKFQKTYKDFIKNEIQKLFSYEIVYQKYPGIRILMPEDAASVVPFHSDKWYNHTKDEVNFWIPLHKVQGSESLQFVKLKDSINLEKKILKNKLNYESINNLILKHSNPVSCKLGQMFKFSPLHLHGNIVNKTELPRISIDFRVKKLDSKFTRKILGGYFETI